MDIMPLELFIFGVAIPSVVAAVIVDKKGYNPLFGFGLGLVGGWITVLLVCFVTSKQKRKNEKLREALMLAQLAKLNRNLHDDQSQPAEPPRFK